MVKHWQIKPFDEDVYQAYCNAGFNKNLAYLLTLRKIKNPQSFLTPLQQPLYDPMLFNDMPKLINRLKQAQQKHEKILIYGDYDVDGITSTVIMINLLKSLDLDFDYYIPKREQDGYGPNLKTYQKLLKQAPYSLFITVDNGITGIDEIDYLNQQNIDCIVIDHHTFGNQLPNAYAIIHPGIPGSNYPESILSGAGVCFKVMQAVNLKLSQNFYEIAALGIIADCMDLVGENRLIVSRGLIQMHNSQNIGLQALFHAYRINPTTVTETDIGFSIAPALNAAGRLEDAQLGVDLLTSDDRAEAEELAYYLQLLNAKRKRETKDLSIQAMQKIKRNDRVNVIVLNDVQKGLVGLIANQVMTKTNKPTIVLVAHDNQLSGSGRSCNGFDLAKVLRPLSGKILDSFGGHAFACGLSLKKDNLTMLKKVLNDACQNVQVQPLKIDCKVSVDQLINFEQVSRMFAPFGNLNDKFKILTKITVAQCEHIGNDQSSIKIKAQNQPNIEFIGFNDFKNVDFQAGTTVYLVGTVQLHYFKQQVSLQFVIDDFTTKLTLEQNQVSETC